jgi:hypothetical protein
VTFASAWALAGLVLLAPLVLLHLRDRGRPPRVVPSLIVWRDLDASVSAGDRGLRLPRLPLLLALQALALVLLVVALAQPQGSAGTSAPGQVLVLDDSLQMSAPGRLADAERVAMRLADADPRGAQIRIVVADGTVSTIYRGAAHGVRAALAHLTTSAAPADLAAALTVAAGLVGGSRDHVTVIRAREDPLPPTNAASGELRDVTVGSPLPDQGLFDVGARCGIGAADVCEVSATIANGSASSVLDSYTAQVAGRPALAGKVRLAAGASADIVLSAVPDEDVSLRLGRAGDVADDTAWVVVPGVGNLPSSEVITLVGTRARSLALAQALVSVPGVTLRLLTPAGYRASDARASGLLVLDGWVPPGGLPPAPALLLVSPPRLGGGTIGAPISDTVVSGTATASPLLDGVDLGSLDVDPGATPRLGLPAWIAPVVWSPDGTLLAAGDDGRQRVSVLAFEPHLSNLPQLAAFPLLVANIVRWSAAWAPQAAVAGVPMLVDATPGARTATLTRGGAVVQRAALGGAATALTAPTPGLYSVLETGPGVRRQMAVAASAATASTATGAPIDLRTARSGPRSAMPPSLIAWFIAIALVALMAEWLYWITRPAAAAG